MNWLRLLLLTALATAARGDGPVYGDANGDGVLNVADHALVQSIVARRIPAVAAADIDGDGQVTRIDADAVADLILGQTPFLAVGSGEIPPEGGSVTAGDLKLTADDLPAAAHLVVAASDTTPPYGGDDDSPLYRIEGLPTDHGQGLTVSLPLASPGRTARAGEVFLEIGDEVSLHSTTDPYYSMSIVAARIENGRLVADIPTLDLPPPGRDVEIPETRTLLVRRVTGVAKDQTSVDDGTGRGSTVPVEIERPTSMDPSEYAPVVNALRAAIVGLKGLGFSPELRTTPIYLHLKDLGAGCCGYYVCSAWSVDNSHLEINLSYVKDASKRVALEQTVFHEYFHMVQAKFDPRYAYTQAKFNAPQLWFDEACSVWYEKFAPSAGGKTSSYMDNNIKEVLAGHHMDCSGLAAYYHELKSKVSDHGYGLSAMLEYLFTQGPAETQDKANPTILNIYTSFKAGATIRDSFIANVPPVAGWWHDFLLAFANNSVGNPGIAFRSGISGRSTSVKFTEAEKSPGMKSLALGACNDCQSWVVIANWQTVGVKDKRRLVVECGYPDNTYRLTALNSARNNTNPSCAEGTSFGKYGDTYVSYVTTPMTATNNGLDIRPLHYLVVTHYKDAPAGAPTPTMNLWYVDAEMPVNSSGYKSTIELADKKIAYSVTGTAASDDALQTHEAILYHDIALTSVAVRGGAQFMVPDDGAREVQISINVSADIADDSVYRITRYRLRAYYHQKDGETRDEILATYPYSPNLTINRTVTLGAGDRVMSFDVYADEEFKPDAELEGNITYSLRSWFNIGVIHRYEVMLEGRYGTAATSRGTKAATPTVAREEVLSKGGTITRKTRAAQLAARLPTPERTTDTSTK